MTQSEAISLECCPECGSPVMKVNTTGLISCLSNLKFGPCSWHVRVNPFDNEHKRERLTKREQKLKELQDEVRRRIEEESGQGMD